MHVLSLFAGIGGLELGLERAGMTVVGQVEIDPFCRRVLAKHWPEVPRHDDVRTAVGWWRGEPRPRVDLICGGFPCQDISTAGKRAGIRNGDRSSLWSFMADAIRRLRPRLVLVENVAAILIRDAHGYIPVEIVAADLASIGYHLRWDCVPAAAIGAPHRRDRWFGIAHPARSGEPDKPKSDERIEVGAEPRAGSGADGRTAASGDRIDLRDAEVVAATMAHAESIGCRQGWAGRPARCCDDWAGIWPQALAHTESARLANRDAEPSRPARGIAGPQRRRGTDRGRTWAPEPGVARMAHGVPSQVDRTRALGNAVVPQVAEHIGRLILEATHGR